MDLLPIESYRFAMICLPWVACRLLVAAICLWSFFFSNKFLWAGVWPCATQIWGESTTHSPSPPKTFVSQTQKVTPQRRNALPWSALISSSLHLFLEQSLISIQSYTINFKSDSNRLLLARYGKIWPGLCWCPMDFCASEPMPYKKARRRGEYLFNLIEGKEERSKAQSWPTARDLTCSPDTSILLWSNLLSEYFFILPCLHIDSFCLKRTCVRNGNF